jgi:hypothetical protein
MRRRLFVAALVSGTWGALAADVPYTMCTTATSDTGMELRNFDAAQNADYNLALGHYLPVAPGRGAAYMSCPSDAAGQSVPVLENQENAGVFAWYVNKVVTKASSPDSDNMGWWFVSTSGAAACMYSGMLQSASLPGTLLSPLLGNVGMGLNSTNWPKSAMVAGDLTIYDASRVNPYPVDSPDRTLNDFDTGYRFVCTGSVAVQEPATTTGDVVVGNQFCIDYAPASTYCGTYRVTYDVTPTMCLGGAYIFQNILYPERIMWYYEGTSQWIIGDSAGAAYTTGQAASCRFDYGVVILTTDVTPAEGAGGVSGSLRSILGTTQYVLAANATSFVPPNFTLEAPAGDCAANPTSMKVLGASVSTAPDAADYAGSYTAVENHPCRAFENANGRAMWFSVDRQIAYLGAVGALSNDCPAGAYYVAGSFDANGGWASSLVAAGAFKTVVGDADAGFYVVCPFEQGATSVPAAPSTPQTDTTTTIVVVATIVGVAVVVLCCGLVCFAMTATSTKRRRVAPIYMMEHDRLMGGETRLIKRTRVLGGRLFSL